MKKTIVILLFLSILCILPPLDGSNAKKTDGFEVESVFNFGFVPVSAMTMKVEIEDNGQYLVIRSEGRISWPIDGIVGYNRTQGFLLLEKECYCVKRIETKHLKGKRVVESLSHYFTGNVKDLFLQLIMFSEDFLKGQAAGYYRYDFFNEGSNTVETVELTCGKVKKGRTDIQYKFSSVKGLHGVKENDKGYIKVDLKKRVLQEVRIGDMLLKFRFKK